MTMPTALHTTGSRVKSIFSLYTRRRLERWITNARVVRKLAVRAQSGRIIWAYWLVEGYETRIEKKKRNSHIFIRKPTREMPLGRSGSKSNKLFPLLDWATCRENIEGSRIIAPSILKPRCYRGKFFSLNSTFFTAGWKTIRCLLGRGQVIPTACLEAVKKSINPFAVVNGSSHFQPVIAYLVG